MSDFSNEWLQTLVEKVSQEYFGMPFYHQATWNNRLQTTGGRYHLKTHHLDFNPKVLIQLGQEFFVSVIKHELCHYHLHLQQKGYRHKDNDFKQLLKQVGGSRYVQWGEQVPVKGKYCYRCTGCGICIYRKRRLVIDKFVCAKCHHAFKLVDN